jgi:hypothetical protein
MDHAISGQSRSFRTSRSPNILHWRQLMRSGIAGQPVSDLPGWQCLRRLWHQVLVSDAVLDN